MNYAQGTKRNAETYTMVHYMPIFLKNQDEIFISFPFTPAEKYAKMLSKGNFACIFIILAEFFRDVSNISKKREDDNGSFITD